MEEVVRKRVVGAVVLVVIGIMLPLLLSRCLHDPAPGGDQAMRVYEITPSGSVEPVGDDTEQATTAPAPSETPAAAADEAEEPAVTDSGNEDAQPPVAEDQAAAPEPAPEPEPVPEPQPEPQPTPE